MQIVTLIVTCSFGLEAVVKRELQVLGFSEVATSDGKIEFTATLQDIPRLNIHLRTADRVLLKLGEFPAADFDQLFDATRQIAWEDWIPADGKITVIGKSIKSKLQSVRSNQSMVKKAIIERLKEKLKLTGNLLELGAEFTIQVAINKDIAQLTLDTTGEGLHKRGYRVATGEAPIRENLAAALVLLSFWNKDKLLIDPMCGSGTILIEAAMIGRQIAPGLNRSFISENWSAIDRKAWKEVREAAKKAILPEGTLKIFGYDINAIRIKDSVTNAQKAGVEKDIIFEQKDLQHLQITESEGIVISNPPYGVHLGQSAELPSLYNSLNKLFSPKPNWMLYIITSDKRFNQYFQRSKEPKVRKLFNGTIEVGYFQYK